MSLKFRKREIANSFQEQLFNVENSYKKYFGFSNGPIRPKNMAINGFKKSGLEALIFIVYLN